MTYNIYNIFTHINSVVDDAIKNKLDLIQNPKRITLQSQQLGTICTRNVIMAPQKVLFNTTQLAIVFK